jgi:hypothetical protein
MSKIEIRQTVFGVVSSKIVGENHRGASTPEEEIARIQRHDAFWEKKANPLVDDSGNYHDPAKCIEWLDRTDPIAENLLTQSTLSLQFHPLFRQHLMTEEERESPLLTWNREEFSEKIVEYNLDLVHFVWNFNELSSTQEIKRISHVKKLKTGFLANVEGESRIYIVSYSDLNPIWRPKSERDFAQEMTAKWQKNASAVEKVMDEKVGLLFKAIKLDLGSDWAGRLNFNLPTLSTTVGGAQHAMPLPRDRYKIMWVHLPTIVRRKTETYSADKLDTLLEEGCIKEIDGTEVTPLRLRGETTGGSIREKEEWARMYPKDKWRKSSSD